MDHSLILLGNRDSRTPGSRSLWTKWLMYLRETYLCHNYNLPLWDDKALLPEILRPVWEAAADAEMNRVDEPIMNVWRDLAMRVNVRRARGFTSSGTVR